MFFFSYIVSYFFSCVPSRLIPFRFFLFFHPLFSSSHLCFLCHSSVLFLLILILSFFTTFLFLIFISIIFFPLWFPSDLQPLCFLFISCFSSKSFIYFTVNSQVLFFALFLDYVLIRVVIVSSMECPLVYVNPLSSSDHLLSCVNPISSFNYSSLWVKLFPSTFIMCEPVFCKVCLP